MLEYCFVSLGHMGVVGSSVHKQAERSSCKVGLLNLGPKLPSRLNGAQNDFKFGKRRVFVRCVALENSPFR